MLSSKHAPERRPSAENLQDGEDAGLTKRIERLENKIDSLEKELWFRSRRYNAALTSMQRTLNICRFFAVDPQADLIPIELSPAFYKGAHEYASRNPVSGLLACA